MRCCYSCEYWEIALKRVPIDVKRELDLNQEVNIEFEGKVYTMPGWKWGMEKPMSLAEIKRLRLCLYGKGMIRPWDECDKYRSRFPHGLMACQLEEARCPHESACRKQEVSYIT